LIDRFSYQHSNEPTLLSSWAFKMDELLDAIAALVSLVPHEKVKAVVASVRRTDASKATTALQAVVGFKKRET
jgi:hypothetical protein